MAQSLRWTTFKSSDKAGRTADFEWASALHYSLVRIAVAMALMP